MPQPRGSAAGPTACWQTPCPGWAHLGGRVRPARGSGSRCVHGGSHPAAARAIAREIEQGPPTSAAAGRAKRVGIRGGPCSRFSFGVGGGPPTAKARRHGT
eukprot:scaffold69711_cov74-Phaeocystis_antarctica.AAC.1